MMGTTFIADAIRDAGAPGDVTVPSELLTLTADLADPIASLAAHDEIILEAIAKAFPFFGRGWGGGIAFSSAEQAVLASLLRWLIAALCDWKRADDPRNSLLVSMFIVTNACDRDGAFWPLLPSGCIGNAQLIECVSKLIASFAVTYGTTGGVQAPIWERETLDRLKKAEADGDWAAIGAAWRPFEAQLFANVLQIQAVRCLSRCGLDYLAGAVANVRQTAVAMQLAMALRVDERFDLAIASDNPYIQFASVYVTFSGRWAVRSLTPDVVQRLARLLIKVAADGHRWTGWLQVFNADPVRYPLLQEALGLALAGVSESARKAYIESIVLRPTQVDAAPLGREGVGLCLRSFHHNATEVQRATLWTVAYERWKQWRFNDGDRNQHFSKINRSQLDYAVVGYASECVKDAELASEIASLTSQLVSIEDNWHVSISDMITEWNRLLSVFQPFAHAQSAKTYAESRILAMRVFPVGIPIPPREIGIERLKTQAPTGGHPTL
jgi:hypothetical protein